MAFWEESLDKNPENICFSDELAERDPGVIAAILTAAAEIYLEGLAAESDGRG